MLSVGEDTFKMLEWEAKKRDVSVQQLLRAVVLPEWVKQNLEEPPSIPPREIAPHLMRQSIYHSQRDQILQTAVGRVRP
jgi:hypothetical protein